MDEIVAVEDYETTTEILWIQNHPESFPGTTIHTLLYDWSILDFTACTDRSDLDIDRLVKPVHLVQQL